MVGSWPWWLESGQQQNPSSQKVSSFYYKFVQTFFELSILSGLVISISHWEVSTDPGRASWCCPDSGRIPSFLSASEVRSKSAWSKPPGKVKKVTTLDSLGRVGAACLSIGRSRESEKSVDVVGHDFSFDIHGRLGEGVASFGLKHNY
jgi:hypothetical protein